MTLDDAILSVLAHHPCQQGRTRLSRAIAAASRENAPEPQNAVEHRLAALQLPAPLRAAQVLETIDSLIAAGDCAITESVRPVLYLTLPGLSRVQHLFSTDAAS